VGTTYNWTAAISNTDQGDAVFAAGETIFKDALPVGPVYGAPAAGNFNGITNSANINCAIDASSTLTCTASGADVNIGANTSSFEVVFSVTPQSTDTLANPRVGGVCKVDPDWAVLESDDTDNDCSDTVNVVGPNLIVTKSNDTGGAGMVGTAFNWTATISNTDQGDAVFAAGETIFKDDLPLGPVYGAPVVSNDTNITNPGSIDCAITANTLICTANGADVMIGANTGKFEVVFSVTPQSTDTLQNPRGGGVCKVDPDGAVLESDDTDNDCSDTVTVVAPNLIVTKSNDTGGAGIVGTTFNWAAAISNTDQGDAVFAAGETIFKDDLPVGPVYGVPAAGNFNGITNSANINCAIDASSTLTCTANGADVMIGANTGKFEVAFSVTPQSTDTLANPRVGGVCKVDPDGAVLESDDTDNECADTVTVAAADGGDVGGNAGGSGEVGGVDEGAKKTFAIKAAGGTYKFGPVTVIIPSGAVDGITDCQLGVAESASGNFELGDQIYDINIACNGQSVTQLNEPIQVCMRPQDGATTGKQIFHQHNGASQFAALPLSGGPAGTVCGDTSQLSLFAMGALQLPATGFAPGVVTALEDQRPETMYFDLAIAGANVGRTYREVHSTFALEIPTLNLEMPIVGVPLTGDGWDVTWLGDQAGYLEGTAYPTWAGNTAFTAHVWDANNQPGPFVDLHTLKHGDEIIIHAWGQRYVYQVRALTEVRPDDLSALPHSEYDVLTLITCQGFDESSGEYGWRLAVRAVLTTIK